MAFVPADVSYPVKNLQHMFDRHKADWGFANVNWNNTTKVQFQNAITNFIAKTPTANAGTYRQQNAWLVVDLNKPHLCAIVYRPGYEIWSGWELSDLQFQHATTPPYSLGGGALAVFGDILESIIQVESHEELDELVNKYMDIYKAHGSERYNDASEQSLSDCFAVLDNYIPPHMAEGMTLQPNHIQSLDVVKEKVNRTLAVLEKNEN